MSVPGVVLLLIFGRVTIILMIVGLILSFSIFLVHCFDLGYQLPILILKLAKHSI